MSRVMSLALKAAQRLKIQNRKLVVAWIAMLAAIVAAFTLGYGWEDAGAPLVLDGETCTSYRSGTMFICEQGKKEYLVVPLPTP
jgi:hypothetical protein